MTIDELETRLNDEFSDIYKCILINGSWGIGKTHFLIKNYLKDKKYVYISLFGLNSIEGLKTEIYSQLNKTLNFIKNGVFNKLSGTSVNLPWNIASLSIPYWENDIEAAIEKKCKKENLIIAIDA